MHIDASRVVRLSGTAATNELAHQVMQAVIERRPTVQYMLGRTYLGCCSRRGACLADCICPPWEVAVLHKCFGCAKAGNVCYLPASFDGHGSHSSDVFPFDQFADRFRGEVMQDRFPRSLVRGIFCFYKPGNCATSCPAML